MEEPYNKLSSFFAKILGKRWMKDRRKDSNSEMPDATIAKLDPTRRTDKNRRMKT